MALPVLGRQRFAGNRSGGHLLQGREQGIDFIVRHGLGASGASRCTARLVAVISATCPGDSEPGGCSWSRSWASASISDRTSSPAPGPAGRRCIGSVPTRSRRNSRRADGVSPRDSGRAPSWLRYRVDGFGSTVFLRARGSRRCSGAGRPSAGLRTCFPLPFPATPRIWGRKRFWVTEQGGDGKAVGDLRTCSRRGTMGGKDGHKALEGKLTWQCSSKAFPW